MQRKFIDCKSCGEAHAEDESLNGYCPKCVEFFIQRESTEQPEQE